MMIDSLSLAPNTHILKIQSTRDAATFRHVFVSFLMLSFSYFSTMATQHRLSFS